MYVEKAVFAKRLQEYEKAIYWVSGPDAPRGAVVHEWRLLSNDELVMKEVCTYGRSLYWIEDGVLD